MSSIPDDIFRAAADVWATLPKESAGIIAIARAILAERERHQWQPIDTAPKDGLKILVWSEGHPVEVAYWEPGFFSHTGWTIYQIRTDVDEPFPPTHWCPLPTPPTTEE